ncbi:hypothetical protein GCM10025864_39580 [Luteimicrobium album]|uniref:Uncharacterized protein n=1 Tax=Luteimicrobium album TaxID=1054550 RepID=A0ABQ6I5Y5_9MICO|nr:hypothetical protein GCM10025864_39580 [Luteimicrobium album]
MFVRVRDPSTGHQFDVPETDRRIGVSLALLDRPHFPPSRYPRPPKHHLNLAGQSASREPEPATAGPEEATEKEI